MPTRRRPASRPTVSQDLKKLGQAVDRIARHTKRLTETLRRLERPTRSAARARTTRKK